MPAAFLGSICNFWFWESRESVRTYFKDRDRRDFSRTRGLLPMRTCECRARAQWGSRSRAQWGGLGRVSLEGISGVLETLPPSGVPGDEREAGADPGCRPGGLAGGGVTQRPRGDAGNVGSQGQALVSPPRSLRHRFWALTGQPGGPAPGPLP